MPDGSVGHCELQMNGETLMLASAFPEMGLSSPQALGGIHAQVVVYVDDLDAHCERARAAGAEITQELRTSSTATGPIAPSIRKASVGTSTSTSAA